MHNSWRTEGRAICQTIIIIGYNIIIIIIIIIINTLSPKTHNTHAREW